MAKTEIHQILSKYLPEPCVDICCKWITEKNIHLRITRGRASKYGDYRPDEEGNGHRISVNHDLNPFSFLITFTHEVAHFNCYLQHKGRREPHGKEWKQEFSGLLSNFLTMQIFPSDIEVALRSYIRNPAASSCSDLQLHRALIKYNPVQQSHVIHLETLPQGTQFSIHQSRAGLVFRKGEKRRTRYHCIEIKSRREYLVSALAEVIVC